MKVFDILDITHWSFEPSLSLQTQAIQSLERGCLIFLPQLPFSLLQEEQKFLSPNFVHKKSKNISFNPVNQRAKGLVGTDAECQQITSMLARFASQSHLLVQTLFPHYKNRLSLGRTSFRPIEVCNRKLSYRKDDRLLHVDAFPATPNQGKRLLRVFSNVNPNGRDRVWRLGESFEAVAKRFLPLVPKPWPGAHALLQFFKITKSRRSAYDHIMLQMHNRMKKDVRYQQNVEQMQLRLPPHSSWIVQTDHVSHAAMSGQHMLEQTFYLPPDAMLDPNQSPLRTLERLVGKNLR